MSRTAADYALAASARRVIVGRAVAAHADAYPTHSIGGGMCGDCDWPFRPDEPAGSATGDVQ